MIEQEISIKQYKCIKMEKEPIKTKINTVLHSILVLILGLVVGLGVGWLIGISKTPEIVEKIIEKEVVRNDTIVRVDTLRYMVEVPVVEKVVETKIINDTVWIKDEPQKYEYNTDRYKLEINATKLYGYNLDVYNVDTTIIYQERLKETITVDKKNWKDYITFSVGVGVQYGLIHKQLDVGPYVGVGIRL